MSVFDEIEARVQAKMQQLGDTILERAKERLSTPFPPASQPNQPPRKRSGKLIEGLTAEVTSEDHVTTLTVNSTAPYTERLEDSGRSVFGDLAEEFTEQAKAMLRDAAYDL